MLPRASDNLRLHPPKGPSRGTPKAGLSSRIAGRRTATALYLNGARTAVVPGNARDAFLRRAQPLGQVAQRAGLRVRPGLHPWNPAAPRSGSIFRLSTRGTRGEVSGARSPASPQRLRVRHDPDVGDSPGDHVEGYPDDRTGAADGEAGAIHRLGASTRSAGSLANGRTGSGRRVRRARRPAGVSLIRARRALLSSVNSRAT